jgi:hypothetical protein
MHIKYWSENLKGRDHLGHLAVLEMVNLKWILKKLHREYGLQQFRIR